MKCPHCGSPAPDPPEEDRFCRSDGHIEDVWECESCDECWSRCVDECPGCISDKANADRRRLIDALCERGWRVQRSMSSDSLYCRKGTKLIRISDHYRGRLADELGLSPPTDEILVRHGLWLDALDELNELELE